MKQKIDNYIFNATAKTVTFTDYTSIRLDGMLLITNVTSNEIIYNFADPTKGGTVSKNILTFTYSTIQMHNTDKLLIYYDADVVQEVHDIGTDKLLQEIEEENELNKVTEERFGVEDLLLAAMDKSSGMPLQVQLPKDLKQEPDGGLLIADMKGPYIWDSLTALAIFNLDCTGYQSIIIHKTTAGIVTPTVSNDGRTYYATNVKNTNALLPPEATLPAATGVYIMPVMSKWLRLTGPASAVQCIIYLSQAPYNLPYPLNIAGTNAIHGGIAGSLAVGGNVATGIAPTSNPVQIAGVDNLKIPLTRRLLTDQLGRLQISTTPTQLTVGMNKLGYDPLYRNILEVQDTTTTEDQSTQELLLQILKELRIMNLQLFELPNLIDKGMEATDEPISLRNESFS
jgi:hypothetical protein